MDVCTEILTLPRCLELASEVLAEHSRQYALASAITDRLRGEDDPIPHNLAEILEDRLADSDQLRRLVLSLEYLCGTAMETSTAK